MGNIAVIPARGGSKRIHRKNIKEFGGHPLITWTISAAKESGLFDRVIVTTDDYEIGRVAALYEAEVYHRDKSLADDHVPAYEATLDVVKAYPDYNNVAQLLPTCPLRSAQDVCESYDAFLESEASAQVSVADYGWQSPWWAVVKDDDMWHENRKRLSKRSQDLPDTYCPTGAAWWAKTDYLLEHGTFYTFGTKYWVMDRMRAIDIDTMEDWRVADAFRRIRKDVG